jgi:hypothetical protein
MSKADKPAMYESPPENIAYARKTMRELKEALTKDANGEFPASYADVDWDGLNMHPPETAWQDMDIGARYDLLLHALEESHGSLEWSFTGDGPRDSKKLVNEFIRDDQRRAMTPLRAAAFDALTTRLEAYGDEFARLARTDGQTALADKFQGFIGEAYELIAWIAEGAQSASRDGAPAGGQPPHPWPSEIAKANREKQPGQDKSKSGGNQKANGHDSGHSM